MDHLATHPTLVGIFTKDAERLKTVNSAWAVVPTPSPSPPCGSSQSSAVPFTPTPSEQQGLLVPVHRELLVAETASGTPLLRPSDRPGRQEAPAISGGAGPGAESQTLFCLVLLGMVRGCCCSRGPKTHFLRPYPRRRELPDSPHSGDGEWGPGDLGGRERE